MLETIIYAVLIVVGLIIAWRFRLIGVFFEILGAILSASSSSSSRRSGFGGGDSSGSGSSSKW